MLYRIRPKHIGVFAEHVTIAFNPDKEINEKYLLHLGEKITLTVVGRGFDSNGDAVVVNGINRLDNKIAHITISCDVGVKAVYSNDLLAKGWGPIDKFKLTGIISAYTKDGWMTAPK